MGSAYVSRIRPPIANSDHNVVHLVPIYKSKLKSNKPDKKVWSSENIEQLKAYFDCTMWGVFYHGSLNEISAVITDYIDLCVQLVIPTKEKKIYPNNKMYITKDVKQVMDLRKIAIKKKDVKQIKCLKKELKGKIREAKTAYRSKLEKAFKSNRARQVWDTMKGMTGLSDTQKPLVVDDEIEFANQLNTFFSRFDKGNILDRSMSIINSVRPECSDRIDLTVEQVRSTFQQLNQRKATGPDNLSAFILNKFADELAPVWQPIFQMSLDTHVIPDMWKTSNVIPPPKKSGAEELGDFRPIALTPIIMKTRASTDKNDSNETKSLFDSLVLLIFDR